MSSRLSTVIKRILQISLSVLLLLQGTGCKTLISQNPADSFKDGKLPRQLYLIANQAREFSLKMREEIIQRRERDLKNPKTLEVAVIDSGMDLTHPDLIQQLAFDVKDGKVVGVGVDIMGKDAFPSYVMVDPTLFAFGAKDVNKGLIEGALESPLAYMKETNDRFMSLLIQEIQSDPELSKTLFARLRPDSMTVFGAHYVQETWKEYRFLEAHNDLKANKPHLLISETSVPIKKDQGESGLTAEDIDKAKKGWDFSREENIPHSLDRAKNLLGFDLFVKALEKTFVRLEEDRHFQRDMENLAKYVAAVTPQRKGRSASMRTDAVEKGVKEACLGAGAFITMGYAAYDPRTVIKEKLGEILGDRTLPLKDAIAAFEKKMTDVLDSLQGQSSLTAEQLKSLTKARLSLAREVESLRMIAKSEENTPEGQKIRSEIRRQIVRSKHPYISPETLENSHHTHVAATIAKQNPHIRIWPVKVTTQTVSAPEQVREFGKKFAQDFETWIQRPEVLVLIDTIQSEYGKSKYSVRAIKDELRKYVESNPLNLLFVHEVLEGIRVTGERKIKLANVSLGMLFEKTHSLANVKAAVAEDLFSEFVRFKMGETIQQKAPATLFLVAAGNDGKWVDGISRSAFPVGVTSPRFQKITSENGLPPTPNNAIKNVLAVGSINPNKGTLTSFTNFLIDSNIGQVFGVGENVRAAINSRATDHYEALVDKYTTDTSTNISAIKELAAEVAKRDGLSKEGYAKAIKEQISVMLWSALISNEAPAHGIILKAKYFLARGEMSGTSMATPETVGKLADYVIQRAEFLGIASKDLYEHPEFAPDKLIEAAYKIAKGFKLSEMVTLKVISEGIKTVPESADSRKAKASVASLNKKLPNLNIINYCRKAL